LSSSILATGLTANKLGVGSSASATGIALGGNANATGANATAVGQGATAAFANSAAFGAGATATAANQMMFGTSSNTYVLPGVNSVASNAAQSGPLYAVTTDATGRLGTIDLASLGGSLVSVQAQLDSLNQSMTTANAGIAMAFAIDVPELQADEKFAITGSWGTFEDQNALSAGFAARISDNISFNGAVATGTDEGTVGGKVGLRIGFK
jgi:hypothetical protein